MNFVNLKYDAAELADEFAAVSEQYAASGRAEPWREYVAGYIMARLLKEPARYVEFGPYWWAVKAALTATGRRIGDDMDAIVLAEYGPRDATGSLDVDLCLLAGELFKTTYAANFIRGTRAFNLTDDGSEWVLSDEDMEFAATAR